MKPIKFKDQIVARALQEAGKQLAKKLGNGIPHGKYTGTVKASLTFTLCKGKDYDTAPTSNLLSMPVLAKAMVMSGIQSDNFIDCLRRSATASLVAGDNVGAALSDEDVRVKDQMAKMFTALISKLPRQPRTGEVKVISELNITDAKVELA